MTKIIAVNINNPTVVTDLNNFANNHIPDLRTVLIAQSLNGKNLTVFAQKTCLGCHYAPESLVSSLAAF